MIFLAKCGKSSVLNEATNLQSVGHYNVKYVSKNKDLKDKIFDTIIQQINQLIDIAYSENMQVSRYQTCFYTKIIANLRKNKK